MNQLNLFHNVLIGIRNMIQIILFELLTVNLT